MKKVVLAEYSGFCFGIKKAYDVALKRAEDESMKVHTLGALLHNQEAVQRLSELGVDSIEFKDINELGDNSQVIIRAHGITEECEDVLRRTVSSVIDCTCPFVKRIHKLVKKYYEDGYQVVIVGDKHHVEVIGINGWCGNSALITKDDVSGLNFDDKIFVVAQTTEKIAVWKKVTSEIKENARGETPVFINTICSATTERQDAAAKLSKESEAVVVIGGKNSSNTKKLYQICIEHCDKTQLISNADELDIEILKGIDIVGITAGASTPSWVIDAVINKIENL